MLCPAGVVVAGALAYAITVETFHTRQDTKNISRPKSEADVMPVKKVLADTVPTLPQHQHKSLTRIGNSRF